LGAMFAVMLGERELAVGKVTLKDMQGGEQEEVGLNDVVEYLQRRATSI
jgi:histidyl-tRNA synthetase